MIHFDTRSTVRPTVLALGLLAALSAPALAQDPEPEGEEPINPFRREAQASPQERMTQLFREVEEKLGSATDLLFDASKGDLSKLEDVRKSGLEDLLPDPTEGGAPKAAVSSLLQASRAQGEGVLRGIDEILEIAEQAGGT